jgi:hypothetical protein
LESLMPMTSPHVKTSRPRPPSAAALSGSCSYNRLAAADIPTGRRPAGQPGSDGQPRLGGQPGSDGQPRSGGRPGRGRTASGWSRVRSALLAGAAAASWAAAATVAAWPTAAGAFCGFFVSGADAQLYNNASQVALLRNG